MTQELAQRLGAALGDGYLVERELGAGGFAIVYLVRDLALKRLLALKVLSPDVISSRSVLERFRREAETVAQLSHPNIVPVHFIGQQDDLLYIAMPCIDGGSITDRLARDGPLPVDDAVRVIREVASALAHAHRRGVIHRDVKPANVLVDAESQRCLVTDFGIARTADAVTLTATGMMLGTPAYLAPEQVTGEPVDARADLFALGVMAYELLAGRLPYEGTTPTAVLMKRLAGPPAPIGDIRSDTPATVADVVMKCLAIDPAERFQNADDIVAALGGDGATPGAASRATRERSKRRPALSRRVVTATVSGLAVIALAATAFELAARSRSASSEARASGNAVPDSGMVRIAAGDYPIGDDSGPELSRPRHIVHVGAFDIDRTEVTVAAFDEYVRAVRAAAPWSGTKPAATLPVTGVSWQTASAYCAWRHRRGGRLPTEFEWEAAARGTAGRRFPWGEQPGTTRANVKAVGTGGLVAVGSYPAGASPEGVVDLIGNVWEWTSSPLTAYAGGTLPARYANDAARYRVSRGGYFATDDALATAMLRGLLRVDQPSADLGNTGFRCAASAVD